VWQRRTGALFEVLAGHDPGGVNSVGWCPNDVAMFASCGDDGRVRIWRPEQNLTPSLVSQSQNGHIRNLSNGNGDSGPSNGISRSREGQFQAPPRRARESPAG
jgi:WD40 repeat protein